MTGSSNVETGRSNSSIPEEDEDDAAPWWSSIGADRRFGAAVFVHVGAVDCDEDDDGVIMFKDVQCELIVSNFI